MELISSIIKKEKILIFHPALAPYRVDFFNAINEAFKASFYFNLTNVLDQKFDQESLKKKCTFNFRYLLNGFELFGRSFRSGIVTIIRKENPDIILCSEYGQVTLIVFLYRFFFRGKYKLYTLSDDSIENSKSRKVFRALLRNIISKNINGVIFPSKEVCNWYNKNISSKTKTLELPIIHNDELFRNELTESLPIANKNIKKYNFEGKKIILFVGRMVKVKNLAFLINAVAKLNTSDWVLVMVGDGILLDDIKNQAIHLNILDKIHFVGRKEGIELLSWYNIAKIFVLPSTYEPFGAVVNEALLAGCKVLCSEIAGASSLINENNGKLFSPYVEKELLTSIEISLTEVESLEYIINKIKGNLMPFTFKEKIDRLIIEL